MASKVRPEARIFSRRVSGSIVPSLVLGRPRPGRDRPRRRPRRGRARAGSRPPRSSRATAARSSRGRPLAGVVEKDHDAIDQAVGGGDLRSPLRFLAIRTPLPRAVARRPRQRRDLAHDDEAGAGVAARAWGSGEPRQVAETARRDPFVGPRAVLDDGDRRGGSGAGAQQAIAHGSGFAWRPCRSRACGPARRAPARPPRGCPRRHGR